MAATGAYALAGSRWGNYAGGHDVVPSYAEMSGRHLRALADWGGDGLAQYVYGYSRLLDLPVLGPSELDLPPEAVQERFESPEDELFQEGEEYLVEAFRNNNRIASRRLASLYFPFDNVEAMAWLLINHEAGGRELARREARGDFDELTEEKMQESVDRAKALIKDLELEPGLTYPAECSDIVDRRSETRIYD